MTADYEFASDVKYVAMKSDDNILYGGMKLLGPNQEQIFDFIWTNSGGWTELIEVPDGTRIVGMKMDAE